MACSGSEGMSQCPTSCYLMPRRMDLQRGMLGLVWIGGDSIPEVTWGFNPLQNSISREIT
jgi:hypothetical protein